MNIDLEVEVLWGVGRNDPSEPQGADREGSVERRRIDELEQKYDGNFADIFDAIRELRARS